MDPDDARARALRESKLAADLREEECAVLAKLVDVRELKDGEILVREGSADERLYVVAAGALGVVKYLESDTRLTVATLGPGDLAGEMGFVDGTSYQSSLVALGNARVLSLARSDLESLLATHPPVVYHVMRAIIRTIHVVQRRLSQQAVELSNYIYKQHGKY
jgi:CRP-like cAMP-binding protein